MTRQRREDQGGLGVAYGLIAGAALGAVLMALTGDVIWVGVGPGLGLLVGLVLAGLLTRKRELDPEGSGDDATGDVA